MQVSPGETPTVSNTKKEAKFAQQKIKIMQEDGIDISHHTSNNILEYKDIDFDFVITVCDHAKEVCPYFPSNAKMLHHNFSDPSKIKGTELEIHTAFQNTRNEIKQYCKEFMEKYLP